MFLLVGELPISGAGLAIHLSDDLGCTGSNAIVADKASPIRLQVFLSDRCDASSAHVSASILRWGEGQALEIDRHQLVVSRGSIPRTVALVSRDERSVALIAHIMSSFQGALVAEYTSGFGSGSSRAVFLTAGDGRDAERLRQQLAAARANLDESYDEVRISVFSLPEPQVWRLISRRRALCELMAVLIGDPASDS